MSSQNRTNLKGVFEQGDKPQGSDYVNLIDSFLNLTDTTAQTVASQLTVPTLVASTKVSAPVASFANVSASTIAVAGGVTTIKKIQSGTAGSRGTAILVQRVTLAANTTAGIPATIVLPSGSNIIDMYVDVEIPFATAVGVTAAEVNVSAAAGVLLARINVSASTVRYGTMQNAQTVGSSGFRNVTTTIEAHVSIQGSPTAMTAGQAMLSVVYVN